ncbi:PREDICTED: protein ZINC INDUCED FACILITATOR 1-like [Lupinus angustifolius]|uniref:protein ZINC INDUCED FACILITATOR 1-like n=1 Tax=Lupinus angustifolius TaxID=3871 RepID=UPI00092EFB3B|nr:PREDICTED: protein ZINC INDUCED FACILITATOR 1-like [Lupinus angustifolius]
MGEENVREPSLNEKYYENCPGCKVDQAKELNPGLSIRNLLIVWIVILSAAMPISSLYPFLYLMVRDFNIAKTEANISSYAGYLGSSFMLGRALTSIMWGTIADRIGRKPVLIIGVISVVIFNPLFGLSTSFWMAIIMRFLLGSLCGVLGTIKAYVSELFREEHQAIGFSTVTAASGLGIIIGPALGGYLAKPVEKYPHIFLKGSFWDKFPYLLPCIIISGLAFAATIVCIWIPETLHNHNDGNKSIDEAEDLENEGGGTDKDKKIEKNENLLLNWPLMSAILVYSLNTLQDNAYHEVFSLWVVSPPRLGGLNFTTNNAGNVLSIAGLALIIYQVCAFPFLEKALGTINITRISGVLSIPLVQSFPFIAMYSGIALFILISIASALRMLLSMTIATGLFLIQNRVVEQHQRGEANGIAMTFMSIFTVIGPASGGAVLSWSQKRMNASFFPGIHMVFFVINIISVVGLVMLIIFVRDKKKICSDEQN